MAAKVIPMPATTHERAQKEIDMCRCVYIRYGWITSRNVTAAFIKESIDNSHMKSLSSLLF